MYGDALITKGHLPSSHPWSGILFSLLAIQQLILALEDRFQGVKKLQVIVVIVAVIVAIGYMLTGK